MAIIPAPVRRVSYKDTLQPALHRRFSATVTFLLAVSYFEAVLLANKSSYLWSCFPFGPTGARTAIIFVCGLPILVLRIAHYHVGLRSTESGLQTFSASLLSLRTYETGFWYGASSLVFSLVFLSSMTGDSNFKWVNYFSGDRARLNERPVLLVSYLGYCALWQTVAHFAYDIDRLYLASEKARSGDEMKIVGLLPKPVRRVMVQMPAVLATSLTRSMVSLLMTLSLYFLIQRPLSWRWIMTFLRPFYNLPKTNMLPPKLPLDIVLLLRCLYAGTLLNLMWSAEHAAFSSFMVEEPLKNGMPLSTESKDPNGSLLNGLKSKKLSNRAFAMWELALIAQRFDSRRRAIYCDIDRKEGPMWAQIYVVCLQLLKSVEGRIDDYGAPAVTPVVPAPTKARQRMSATIRQDAIMVKGLPDLEHKKGSGQMWDHIARSPGSSPAAELGPLARKIWRGAKDRMLSKQQQQSLSPDSVISIFEKQITQAMRFGILAAVLRRDFRPRFAAVILGRPFAEASIYVNAVSAICDLAASSLEEDMYGNVQRDVASIIRLLTTVIIKTELLRERFPLHWTDAEGSKQCFEVDQVLGAMRAGLKQVVSKFEPYSDGLGLSASDSRRAKEASADPASANGTRPAAKEAVQGAKEGVDQRRIQGSLKSQRRERKGQDMSEIRR